MLKNHQYKFNILLMKERNFQEWINFFITFNLSLFAVLMFFVPAYPWWAIAILALISGFIVPRILKNRGSRNRSRF